MGSRSTTKVAERKPAKNGTGDEERAPQKHSFWVNAAAKIVAVAGGIGLVVGAIFSILQFWTFLWGTPHADLLQPQPNYRFPVGLGAFAAAHREFPASRDVLRSHSSDPGAVFAVRLHVSGGERTTCTLRWSAHDPKSLNALVPLPHWAPTSERLSPCSEDGLREIWVPLPGSETTEFVQYEFELRSNTKPSGRLLDIGDTQEIELSSG
jgi:hypothetical protein